MSRYKYIRIFILLIIIFNITLAQISRDGTSAVGFLMIEPGSRAVGMGTAHVAVGGDSYTVYYNPAGLSEIKFFEMDLQRTNWIADITYDFLSIAFPVHRSIVAGIQIISLSMTDMEVRTELNQNGTGEMFSAGDLLLGTSLAFTISDRFSVGGTFKYVREHIWHMTADGLAFDIGTRYKSSFMNTVIGVAISNFGERLQMEGRDVNIRYDPSETFYGNNDEVPAQYNLDEFAMPLTFRIGLSSDLFPSQPGFLSIAIDAVHPYSTSEFVNVGAEFKPLKFVSLRGGYKSLFYPNSEEGLTFGAGLQIPISNGAILDIDAAYIDFGRFSSVTQYSLGLSFPR